MRFFEGFCCPLSNNPDLVVCNFFKKSTFFNLFLIRLLSYHNLF
jgi:hypothetical protein